MPDCPTIELLKEFVRNGKIADDVYAHIENCEACGRLIEELCSSTDQGDSPTASAPSLGTPRTEDLAFLQRLATNPPSSDAAEDAHGIRFPGADAAKLGELDCYRIERRIDGGGFGEVFEAWDNQVQRPVALKVIHAAGFDRKAWQRFQREAQAAGAVNHENVVVLHRVIEPSEEFPYACLVMEYVRGGSLRRQLELEESIEIPVAVRWIVQAARGLEAVHAAGLLHRDIKPGNLLIDETGTLKLGDFGLARPLATETQASVHIAGTPPYMSPEQLQTPDKLTIQSDIYGLGVVLYQLLTGMRPFQGKDEVLRKQIIESSPPAIRPLNPRVSRDLETVCLRCLHKDPTRRFESAQALADDLQSCLAGRPIKSRPIAPVEKAYWWVRSHPTLTTVLVSSCCIAVAALLVAWRFQELSVKATLATQQAVDNAQLAMENAELIEQSQSQLLESMQLMVDQLSDQVGGSSRLVPLFKNFVERLDRMDVPQGLQGARGKAVADLHVRLAMLFDRMAPTLQSRDVAQRAAEHFAKAIAIYEALEATGAERLVSAYDGLAGNCINRGQYDEAESNLKKSLEFCDAQLRKQPSEPMWLRCRAVTFESLAKVAEMKGQGDERLKHLLECLRIREQLFQVLPSAQARHDLANVLVFLGDVARGVDRDDRLTEAAKNYGRAIELAESAVAQDASEVAYNRTLANALDRMSLCVAPEESLAWSQRALAIREKFNRLDPQGHASLHDLLVSYIGILSKIEDQAEVKRLLDLSNEFAERWLGLAPDDIRAIGHSARIALKYCDWHDERGELSTALKYVQRAVELRRQGLKLSPSASARLSLLVALKSLGHIQIGLDENFDIMPLLDEQISILKQMVDAHEYETDTRVWLQDLQRLKAARLSETGAQ